MTEDPDYLQQVFWAVCLADFPGHEKRLTLLLPAAKASVVKGELRPFYRACAAFVAEGHPWPRYDAHLAFWREPDPRIPEFEDREEVRGPDFREAGKLLAHRIIMTYYAGRRFVRFRENVLDRPYWRLSIVDDGCTPDACKAEARTAHRYDAPYWTAKTLPCERLFCRCILRALTAREFDEIEPS